MSPLSKFTRRILAWRGRYDGGALEMTVERERKYALAVTGASIVLLIFGYVLGHTGGADLDAAKAAGTKAGTVAGTKQGKQQGYDAGYKKGYRTSYKAAYEKAKRGD
jgi:hypothetical protein